MNLLDKALQSFRSVAALLSPTRAAFEAAQLGRCTSFDEYQRFLASTAMEQSEQRAREAALQGTDAAFDVPGYCSVCGRGRGSGSVTVTASPWRTDAGYQTGVSTLCAPAAG